MLKSLSRSVSGSRIIVQQAHHQIVEVIEMWVQDTLEMNCNKYVGAHESNILVKSYLEGSHFSNIFSNLMTSA